MSFTPVSVQGRYTDPDGAPSGGLIQFQLTAPMVNDEEIVSPIGIIGPLDEGVITDQAGEALILLANNDTGTTPASPSAAYYVTPKVNESEPAKTFYFILDKAATVTEDAATITSGQPTVTLGKYLAASSMVGQPATGSLFPGGTTVLSVDTKKNTVTLSNNATGSSAGATGVLVIGGAVDLSTVTELQKPTALNSFIPFVGGNVGDVLTFTGYQWVAEAPSGGNIHSVQPGAHVTVDTTDPHNPIVNVTGSDFDAAGAAAAAQANAISAAATSAASLYVPLSQRGAASGVATLDSSSHVPLAQLAGITGTQLASSVALAGSPTTTTQPALTSNTTIATTAYADAAVLVETNRAVAAEATFALKATTITASTGLTGGGDLSANRTIALANTAVAPGNYGSGTQVATFTVDQQGRLTNAANVTITGAPPTGAAGGVLTGSYPNPSGLANTAVAAGAYPSDTSHVATFTVAADGRLTAAASGQVTHAAISDWAAVTAAFLTSTTGMLRANNLSDVNSVVTAIANLGLPVYSFNAYGADPTGVGNSTTAITNAQAAAIAAAPSVLYAPPGAFNCDTGVLSRTTLAAAGVALIGGGNSTTQIIWNAGNGIGLDTELTDHNYWFTSGAPYYNARPIAPVMGITFNCENLTAGGIGVRHGPGIGGYYDCYILNGTGLPSDNGSTITNPGVRGFQLHNAVDNSSTPIQRYTEETRFGPNFGVENCYVGMEFDAAAGTSSFGYTKMLSTRIRIGAAGQTGIVVRNSTTPATGAQVYNSDLNIMGNLSQVVGGLGTTAGAYYNAQQTIGTLTTSPSGVQTLSLSGGTAAAIRGGTVLQLGSDSAHQVTVAATAGTASLAEYGYYAAGATSIPLTATYSGTATNGAIVTTANGGNVACILGAPNANVGGGSVTSITLAANLPFKLYDGQLIRVTDLNYGQPPTYCNGTFTAVSGTNTATVTGTAQVGAPVTSGPWNAGTFVTAISGSTITLSSNATGNGASALGGIGGCQQLFMVSGFNNTGQATINVYAHTPIDLRHVTYTFGSAATTVELISTGIVVGWSGTGTHNDGSVLSGGLVYRVENGSNHIINTANIFVSTTAQLSCTGAMNGDTFSIAPSQFDGTLQFDGPFTSVDYQTDATTKVYTPVGEQKSGRGLLTNGSLEMQPMGVGNGTGYPGNTTGGMFIADSPDGGFLGVFAPNTNIHLRPLGAQTSTGEVIIRSTTMQFTATGTHTFSGLVLANAGLQVAALQSINFGSNTLTNVGSGGSGATNGANIGDITTAINAITFGQDLSGAPGTAEVVGIMHMPVTGTPPTTTLNRTLFSDTAGNLQFAAFGGDVATKSSGVGALKVTGWQTTPIDATTFSAPASAAIPIYDGTTQFAAHALTGDITLGTSGATTVAKINGTVVSSTTGTTNVVFSASPALTGTPTAPTAAANTNNTQLATTAYADTAAKNKPSVGLTQGWPLDGSSNNPLTGPFPRILLTLTTTTVATHTYACLVPVEKGVVYTNVNFIANAGSTFSGTSPHQWYGLYSTDGTTKYTATGDLTTAAITGSAVNTVALSAGSGGGAWTATLTGYVYIVAVMNAGSGGTQPSVYAGTLALGTPSGRTPTLGQDLTTNSNTPPSSLTFNANATQVTAFWLS